MTDDNFAFKNIAETIVKVMNEYSLNAQSNIDKKFKVQLTNSIYILTNIYVLLNKVLNYPSQSDVSDEIFESQMIMWQACNTSLSALQLIRQGYPLEPQFLMRVSIEDLALAVCFHLDEESFSLYKNGKLSGNNCIGKIKTVIGEIGSIYGLLSEVSHPTIKVTGNGYNEESKSVIIGGGYTEKMSNRTLFSFSLLNYLLLNIWKGSEFVFYDFTIGHKFWIRINSDYQLKIDESIKGIISNVKSDFENAIKSIDEEILINP